MHSGTMASVASVVRPRVLTTVVGSGPNGETARSHFWTVDELPDLLHLAPLPATPVRRDLDLGEGGLAFVIDGVMTPEEADALAGLSEAVGYSKFAPAIRTPPGMRQNTAAHWLCSEAGASTFMRPLFERFRHLLPQQISGEPLWPELSHRVAHYKYVAGERFNPHTDGQWPGQSIAPTGDAIEEWPRAESRLSMLLYLSDEADGFGGGATRLFRFDGGPPLDVAPRKGSALFFRHGFGPDSVLHAGLPVTGAVPKYVARLNVLYGEGSAPAA